MSTELNAEKIEKHYRAMKDSAWLINAIISGEQMSDATEEERRGCVERNVNHLILMRHADFWTNEDMSAIDSAIEVGKSYG